MKRFNILQLIFIMLTIAIMICIFMFSSENSSQSSDTSGTFTKTLINFLYNDFNSMPEYHQTEIYNNISHIIRKTAHFSIYTTLGLFSSLAVGKRKFFSIKNLAVIMFCFLYARSDEIHQYFVPGRACMFNDVILDTFGSITGVLISMLIIKIISKKIAVPE